MKNLTLEIVKLVVLLLLSSAIIFLLISLSPIDPLTSNYGQNLTSRMTPEKVSELESYWGVGKPFFERLASWLGCVATGNFGESLIYNEPVINVIIRGLKNSAPIMLVSWLLSGLIGYSTAILVAMKKDAGTKCITLLNYCLISTPTYFIAILLLILFSGTLNWVPVTSAASLQSAIMPCIVLTLFGAPTIFFHTKAKCEEVLQSDFVKHARNKGLTAREITKKHVLKNVSLPFLSIEFAQIGEIIGGSVVVEQVFSYPGLGGITVKAATSSDVCLLAGISLITCAIVFLGNLACKIIVRATDPRLKND